MIVAAGPSLSDDQCAMLTERRAEDGCRVFVVNNAYRYVPTADLLYACDFSWWKFHHGVRATDGQPGVAAVCPRIEKYSCENAAMRPYGTSLARLVPGRGILEPGKSVQREIRRGSGGGFQAAGLAIAYGATNIILVGMDCKKSRAGLSHRHGDHPLPLRNDQPFKTWADEFDSMAGPARQYGIRIVNCSLDSAIRAIPVSDLERELWPSTPT